jgi:hypothetical protein
MTDDTQKIADIYENYVNGNRADFVRMVKKFGEKKFWSRFPDFLYVVEKDSMQFIALAEVMKYYFSR